MPRPNICLFVCFGRDSPPVGQGLLFYEVSRPHTTTHHSRQDSSWWVISLMLRPLPINQKHSEEASVRAPGGIRTHDPSKREAADLRLRPRGHWDRYRYILHLIVLLQLTKIILQFCKWQWHWTNKYKERNLNCVWTGVSASRSRSWAFQRPPMYYPVIKTFKLAERKRSYTLIHPRCSGR